jgi:hypothetical protein
VFGRFSKLGSAPTSFHLEPTGPSATIAGSPTHRSRGRRAVSIRRSLPTTLALLPDQFVSTTLVDVLPKCPRRCALNVPPRTAAEHDSFPRPVGHSHAISKTNERPDLDDVMRPTEEVHPDRREHAKEAKHRDDATGNVIGNLVKLRWLAEVTIGRPYQGPAIVSVSTHTPRGQDAARRAADLNGARTAARPFDTIGVGRDENAALCCAPGGDQNRDLKLDTTVRKVSGH